MTILAQLDLDLDAATDAANAAAQKLRLAEEALRLSNDYNNEAAYAAYKEANSASKAADVAYRAAYAAYKEAGSLVLA